MFGSPWQAFQPLQPRSYTAVSWQPYSLCDWELSATFGLMHGYPALKHGGTFFAELPIDLLQNPTGLRV